MKKSFVLSVLIGTFSIMPLFALKIPTGDNVRATDVKQDGDAIVEVMLNESKSATITTPVGPVKAAKGTPVTFYKSGALKSFYPSTENEDRSEVETPIGKMILNSGYYNSTSRENYCCEFYESGCPKKLYLYENTVISVKNNSFGILAKNGYGGYSQYPISFYDSGKKNEWQVKRLTGSDSGITYTNESGKFKIGHREGVIEFWQNGSIKYAPLCESPEVFALVKGNEVYIKGKEKNCRIGFFEDGSISEFVSDEACLTEQGGLKLTIVANEKVCLWKNGNIRQCSVSNPNNIKVGDVVYKLKGKHDDKYDIYLFNEDGTLKGFSYKFDQWSENVADKFYANGNPRRTINLYEEYSNSAPYDGKNYIANFYYEAGGLNNTRFSIFLQDGDSESNLAMVYCDAKNNLESYTLFMLDENGEYLLDEYGIPMEDTKTRKKFK